MCVRLVAAFRACMLLVVAVLASLALFGAAQTQTQTQAETSDEELCVDHLRRSIEDFVDAITTSSSGDEGVMRTRIQEHVDKFYTEDLAAEFPSFMPRTHASMVDAYSQVNTPPGCGLKVTFEVTDVMAVNNSAVASNNPEERRINCVMAMTFAMATYSTEKPGPPCLFTVPERLNARLNPHLDKMEVFNLNVDGPLMGQKLGSCFKTCFSGHGGHDEL
ncbi:hypothetical protein PTSG_02596 [Salpingoeca rosetta]|uniref:Uncharacterized protein n=1 Tax=Salpingoeca rosetta (strain ATCC 50818 / BSB-021) TaxID=946362 RepID=F2U2R7_SALR5|nr:uncharacterized protein PTSG_02596 [Salpingoeca rosetta]EGD81911.1 hypothetical protein PTSG_02596 [Salpingoeca rosetta]|eukprot:XP_004996094.1 hypothetical protein PTSG_02596 [Salpingoeca rosetta]